MMVPSLSFPELVVLSGSIKYPPLVLAVVIA